MLVRHFADARVGAVCGALRFEASAESQQTEGVYWRYETMLRLMESRLGVTLTASGAIYALRRECFVPLPADTLVEDLLVPVNTRRARVPRALRAGRASATDFAPPTVAGEFTRRVRIATGSFRALGQVLRGPLDPAHRLRVLLPQAPALAAALPAAGHAGDQRAALGAPALPRPLRRPARLLCLGAARLGLPPARAGRSVTPSSPTTSRPSTWPSWWASSAS